MPKKNKAIMIINNVLIVIIIAFLVLIFTGNSFTSVKNFFRNNVMTKVYSLFGLEDPKAFTEENAITIQNTEDYYYSRFYYEQINSDSQYIYNFIRSNIDKFKDGKTPVNFDGNKVVLVADFQTAWDALTLDKNEEVFYIETKKLNLVTTTENSFWQQNVTYQICPEANSTYFASDFNSADDVERAKQQIEEKTADIIINARSKVNRYEQVRYVHNWIIDNCIYDSADANTNNDTLYGTMIEGVAVCEGYAKTFKYLLDKLGIPCVQVYGYSISNGAIGESHAWNYVQMDDGKWYAVDTTWDDPLIAGSNLTDRLRYKYFLVGSTRFVSNHKEDGDVSHTGQKFTYPVLSTNDY